MLLQCFCDTSDVSNNFNASSATLIVGILGFTTAILTLIYSNYSNKRNHNFLLEKDKRDREDRLKKDELDFAKDKREKQRAYNRILGSFLKLYHSYINHKYFFKETGIPILPDSILTQIVEKIDNFNSEVKSFKKTFNKESEIVPELTIYLHDILIILERFKIVVTQISNDPSIEDPEKIKLIVQRAHLFAVEEMLDKYFIDLIDSIANKAEVSDEFLEEIKEFNSKETVDKNIELQSELFNRFLESISRQTGQSFNDLSPK